MEEKNDLNDILIKNGDTQKSNGVKNILLFTAITLLIFFIGILSFKLISTDDDNDKMVVKKDNSKKEELFEDLPVEKSEEEAKENLDKFISCIGQRKELVGFGEAPIFKLQNRFRYYALFKGKNLHKIIYPCIDLKVAKVDMDVINFV